MDALIRQPLFYIYFIYGVSFLVMAYVIFRGIRRATSMVLVTTFWVLAAFGLTHGIREMLDWVGFIVESGAHARVAWLELLSDAFLIVSYVILLQFAVNLLSYRSERRKAYRMIPGLLVAAGIVAIVATGSHDSHQVGLWVRHSFGFAGALLSGVAFCKLAVAMRAIGNTRVEVGLLLGAVGFIAYSVFGGLIVTTVAGQPVQIFRALCAFTIAAASILILGIFRQAEA
jgi:Flp pilus assembly pilin Flp